VFELVIDMVIASMAQELCIKKKVARNAMDGFNPRNLGVFFKMPARRCRRVFKLGGDASPVCRVRKPGTRKSWARGLLKRRN
jgi:hypothetical protein